MDFFTSDLHLGHKNIIEYCGRPFRSVEGMDRALIQRWNETVGADDTVYVLGDFSFYKPEKSREILHQLKGRKVLVRGNHDRSEKTMLEIGFDEVHDWFDYDDRHLVHDPADADHLPPDSRVLCGHVHGSWRTKTIEGVNFVNVGVDVWGYRPVTLDQIRQATEMPAPVPTVRRKGKEYL